MRAPSACATASGGVFTPRATWRRRSSITRSVVVVCSEVAMAPSSRSALRFANGSVGGLFLGRDVELPRLDQLCRGDGGACRLGRTGLAAAGEIDAQRDRAALRLRVLAEVCLLPQLVDVVAGRVVALGLQALAEVRAGVGGRVYVLGLA